MRPPQLDPSDLRRYPWLIREKSASGEFGLHGSQQRVFIANCRPTIRVEGMELFNPGTYWLPNVWRALPSGTTAPVAHISHPRGCPASSGTSAPAEKFTSGLLPCANKQR